ncbi:MAG TPA: hypothetical protein ACHBX0_13860 [Arsenophonus sp.]
MFGSTDITLCGLELITDLAVSMPHLFNLLDVAKIQKFLKFIRLFQQDYQPKIFTNKLSLI